MHRKPKLDAIASILLLVCCLFWGAQQVLVKATLPMVPPVLQAAVRFLIATVLLCAWCAWRGIPLFKRDHALGAGILAGSLFALEFIALYLGLAHTSASRLTIFLYTSPFIVALILPLIVPAERLKPLQWVGLGCAFAAVTYALTDAAKPGPWWADALALAAGAFWGLTTVVIRSSKLGSVGAEKLLFYQIATCSLLLPWVSLGLGEDWQAAWGSLNRFALVSVGLQAAVGAFASYLTWMWLLGRYPATRLMSFTFLTPVFTLMFAALWLGEPVTVPTVLALLGVGVGIVLVNRK
jgi:drug/metabolite transporter (DMT)-like permease